MKKIGSILFTLSAILMLVGWSQAGRLSEENQGGESVSVSHPRIEVPDYPLDAGLFAAEYGSVSGTAARNAERDDRKDGSIFYEFYLQAERAVTRLSIPDYPLDGEFYSENIANSRRTGDVSLNPDDRKDGRLYNEFFLEGDRGFQSANPDDRADGLIFQRWFAEGSSGEGILMVPDYPADAWMFRSE